MQININENKYNVKRKGNDNDYQLLISLKRRNCKLCKKVIEVTEFDSFGWFDDNHYWRTGYFCKRDRALVEKALKIANKV